VPKDNYPYITIREYTRIVPQAPLLPRFKGFGPIQGEGEIG